MMSNPIEGVGRTIEGVAQSEVNATVMGGVRGGFASFWRLFKKRKIQHIIRMGIIGQPGSGKTRLLANLVLDRDRLDVGVGINWQAEALHRLLEQTPTYEPTVLLEGTLLLRHLPGISIPFQAIDTMGGLTIDRANSTTFSADQRKAFHTALRSLDLLALVIDPDLVFSENSKVLQANLSEHVSVVLKNRDVASVILLYTKADSYGMQYASTGRLLNMSHVASLERLTGKLQGADDSMANGIVPLLNLARRFPVEAERKVAEDVIARTEHIWRSILLHGPKIPWQFNAYFVAGEPALPKEHRKVEHGVGVDVAINDFLGRIKQPWWPFWDAPEK
jgi:hypothetical protein